MIIELNELAPQVSDVELDDTITGKFLILNTTVENGDMYYSIVPDNEYYRNIIDVNGFDIVASGESAVSIAKLIYGLNHSERVLYKRFVQDIRETIDDRYSRDDALLRTELNKIGKN